MPQLREKLARIQVSMIESSIPGIIKEVDDRSTACLEKLKTIGREFQTEMERRDFFTNRVNYSVALVDDLLSGRKKRNSESFYATFDKMRVNFRHSIFRSRLANVRPAIAPGMEVSVATKVGEINGRVFKVIGENKYLIDPLDDRMLTESPFLNSMEKEICGHYYPIGRSKLTDGTNIFICTSDENKNISTYKKYEVFSSDHVRPSSKWLEEWIRANLTMDLKCFLSPSVFNKIVSDMIEEEVKPLAFQLFESLYEELSEIIISVFKDSFSFFPRLCDFVNDIVACVCIEVKENAVCQLNSLLERESHPFIQNHYLFELLNKKRNEPLLHTLLQNFSDSDINGKTVKETIKAAFAQNERKSIEEHVAFEMQITLDSYGKVAIKRLIDNVPMIVESMNVVAFKMITDGRIRISEEQLRFFVQEKPEIVAKRSLITTELNKMKLAKQAIISLRNSLL